MYKSEEIQLAVEALIQGRIRRPVDYSGVRLIDEEFADLQGAAVGVFLTEPNAVHNILELGKDRLAADARALLVKIEELETLLDATTRKSVPIANLTDLANAENALLELESTLGSRTAMPQASASPAVAKFQASTDAYLNEVGPNIKENGQIVPTAQEAKASIPALFKEIIADYEALVDTQDSLSKGLSDFASVKLPARAALQVVSQSRAMLSSDRQELEKMPEEQRLSVIKTKVLNAITAKSAVETFVSGQQVQASYPATGLLRPYTDESHLGQAAEAISTIPGPYALLSYPVAAGQAPDPRDTNRLLVTTQGRQSVVLLPTSYAAFLMGNSKPQPPEDPNPTYTFYGAGAEFDPIGNPAPKGPYFAENFAGNEAAPGNWFVPPTNDTFIIEEFTESGYVYRYTVNLINKAAGGDPATTFNYPKETPPAPPTPCWTAYKLQLTLEQVAERINAVLIAGFSRLRAVRSGMDTLQIQVNDVSNAFNPVNVGIRCPSVIVGGKETNTACQSPLGFVLGLESMSQKSSAMTVAKSFTGSTSAASARNYAWTRHSKLDHVRAYTNLGDKASVIIAKCTEFGSTTASGNSLVVTIDSTKASFISRGVVVGDDLYFPRQYALNTLGQYEPVADEGAMYQVTKVEDYRLEASYLSGPHALASFFSRNFDVGDPACVWMVPVHDAVEIFEGPNQGTYEITAKDPYSPFRLSIDTLLSQNKQARDPLPLEMVVSVGPMGVAFASADQTTSSSIELAGSAKPLFFGASAAQAFGYTSYVELPVNPPKVQEGDIIEFESAAGSSVSREVVAVEGRVLTLDAPIPCGINYQLNASTYPRATIVVQAVAASNAFSQSMTAWQAKEPTNLALFAANLTALINPLLGAASAGQAFVAQAKAKLQELKVKVQELRDTLDPKGVVNRLEAEFDAAIAQGRTAVAAEIQADLDAAKTVLNTIKSKVDPSPAVNDLIKTFKSKGADKAIDTLMKGKFSTFFNMKMEEASYAGSLKLAAAEVVRMDLTVNKFGETRLRRQVISVTEDTDPDYDFSDSEAQAPKLDSPVQLDFHASITDALPALDYHLEWPEKG